MKCINCEFYQSGYLWNRCSLMEAEYYKEYYTEPCPIIDDNYNFIDNSELFGDLKGTSAIKYMNKESNDFK